MNCRQTRRLFDGFREQTLDPAAESAVSGHLSECKECRLALGEMDLLEQRLTDAMTGHRPSEGFAARVMTAVELAQPPAPARNLEWLKPVSIAAAACTVISLCFWGLATRTEKPVAPVGLPRDVVAIFHEAPKTEPAAKPAPRRAYAVGEAFVIGRKGTKPYSGPTHLTIARVVRGAPELIVEAFPEG